MKISILNLIVTKHNYYNLSVSYCCKTQLLKLFSFLMVIGHNSKAYGKNEVTHSSEDFDFLCSSFHNLSQILIKAKDIWRFVMETAF